MLHKGGKFERHPYRTTSRGTYPTMPCAGGELCLLPNLTPKSGIGVRHRSKDTQVDKLVEALDTLSIQVHRAHQQRSSPDTELVEVLKNLKITPGDRPNSPAIKAVNDWVAVEDKEEINEALKLDGVDEMTEHLNNTHVEEENVSDMEEEGVGKDSGGGACHRLMRNFLTVLSKASQRSVALPRPHSTCRRPRWQ